MRARQIRKRLESRAMSLTSGKLLVDELRRRNIRQAELARRLNKTPATVLNWTKDKGFGPDQRALVAKELGEAPTFFDRPSLAQQREENRLKALTDFIDLDAAYDITADERKCLESIRWPAYVKPTAAHYWGVFLVMRGLITLGELEQSLPSMMQAVEQHLSKKGSAITPKIGGETAAKKAKKRARPKPPHR